MVGRPHDSVFLPESSRSSDYIAALLARESETLPWPTNYPATAELHRVDGQFARLAAVGHLHWNVFSSALDSLPGFCYCFGVLVAAWARISDRMIGRRLHRLLPRRLSWY